jgi:serine/threonine-protein kinase
VLYELFTGKRAFEARNLQDLASLQRSTPTHPSTHVSGLNPVIERAILRCTDPDPARRPASAHALADALPGGDPLAMAIAAGETPSPEMVAHAGGAGTLRPLVAAACLATILAGLAGVWFASAHASLFRRVPLTLSPTELTAAARSAIAALGYPAPPVDVAYRYAVNGDQTGAIAKSDQSMNRWDQLSTAVPPPAYFWYRESPVPLVPANSVTRTGELDPPVTRAGMVSVRVDPAGHLWFFRAKPPSLDAGPERATEPDWQKPFSLAGLDPSSFAPADPRWTPPEPSDTRRAWVKGDLRIEAAAFRGRLVWFEVIPAWKVADTGAATPQTMGQRAGQAGAFAFVGGILLFAGFLARRNLRLGRGDSKGAVRLAALFSVLATMVDVLETSSSQAAFFGVVVNNLSLRLFTAGVIWLTYLAIEPYVRRLWPHALITWSRLLDGRLRDPLVGRDLLYGGVAGMVVVAVQLLPQAAPRLGLPPPVPVASGLVALHGTAAWMAAQFRPALSSFAVPVEILLGLLVFRVTFRKPWLAYGMFFLALGLVLGVSNPGILQAVSSFSIIVLATVIVTRLGLVAFMVAIAFSSWNTFPLTTDPASWYFPYSAMTMMLFAAVAVYGFVVAVGDRLRFKDSVLD